MLNLVRSFEFIVRRLKTTHYKLPATHRRFQRLGFTLVELLVVITIMSIISSICYINFNVAQNKGRDARRKADLRTVKTALVSYYQDNGAYPPSCTDPCEAFADSSDKWPTWLKDVLVPKYLKELPKDPRQASFVTRLANLIPKFGGRGQAPQPQVAAATTTTLRPTGAGAATTWTRTGCTANWQCVDEETLNTSDYLTAPSSGRTTIEWYATGFTPPAGSTIPAIRVFAQAKKTDADTTYLLL